MKPFGLEGKSVTSLGIYGRLYAGTDGAGVFKRANFGADTGWVSLGLDGKKIRAVYPHKYGPLGWVTTVGLELGDQSKDSALVYCSQLDQLNWAVTDSGIPRDKVRAIRSLDGFPDLAICGETFAATIGSSAQIWRRGFTSTHWEPVMDIGVGVANVVLADEATGEVWAGGETGIFAPWIARSKDKGDHWDFAYPDLKGDNACNCLVIDPQNPDIAYAGMEGPVIKTIDGGKTWSYTGLRETGAYIYGIALDAGSRSHIFAGGTIANPNTWAMWESFDAGETWREIPAPVLVTPVVVSGISSIIANPSQAGVVYIATFGHGVWKYESLITGIDDPPQPRNFVLEQNYPNPFSASGTFGNPATTIRFEISPELERSSVQVAIFDVNGKIVRLLEDRRLHAGPHQVIWDGRKENGELVSSAVYFCRLQIGAVSQVRKLSLLK
jgi:hypothetical protein